MDRSRRRLELAVGAAALEVCVQIVVLIGRGVWSGAPLRIVFLAAKLPFCWLALRRHPGAFLALWLYEFIGVVAVFAVRGAVGPRIGGGIAAAVVLVLLGRATAAFPPVEWRTK